MLMAISSQKIAISLCYDSAILIELLMRLGLSPPQHLLSDEKFSNLNGEEIYLFLISQEDYRPLVVISPALAAHNPISWWLRVAAIKSGNWSGVQAKAGLPRVANAPALR
jgi:hypothetical protein